MITISIEVPNSPDIVKTIGTIVHCGLVHEGRVRVYTDPVNVPSLQSNDLVGDLVGAQGVLAKTSNGK